MTVEKVRKLVEKSCRSPKNFYGYSAWTHHIALVEKYGIILAKKLKADLEIVRLACLLHDYSCILDKKYYTHHHFYSAKITNKILNQLNYPPNKIRHIQECILSHRGSLPLKKGSLEAKILSDADALAHFDVIDDLFLLAYQVLKLKTDEGRKFVLQKLNRSYKKMSPIARSLVREKYRLVKKVFVNI
jgi:uncharacterized protein